MGYRYEQATHKRNLNTQKRENAQYYQMQKKKKSTVQSGPTLE